MLNEKDFKHLLKIEDLNAKTLILLLDQAQTFIQEKKHLTCLDARLKNFTLANIFFETSTRTRISFELAAKRLGAEVINFDVARSSAKKGESLLDTIYTLEAMNCQFFVIRHTENNILDYVSQYVSPRTAIINAGDGTHAHPTQALIDMLTIRQLKNKFTDLSVAIIGDILHSRVARSQLAAMKLLGIKDIRLIGPAELLPSQYADVSCISDMQQGLSDVDVVILLRIQKERMTNDAPLNDEAYFRQYGLTQEKLTYAKPDAIVMHPGPMNRGVEIANEVADGKQSVILRQVSNGIAIRMAVLSYLSNTLC